MISKSESHSGFGYYTIAVDKVLNGPSWSGQTDVFTIDIFAKYPDWGEADQEIIKGNTVEVYGRIMTKNSNVHSVTLNGRKEYYMKKLSGAGCDGTISGHVYDAITKEPICEAKVLASGGRYEGDTDNKGHYAIESICPSAAHLLTCLAEGYESATNKTTVDEKGDAKIDFYLNPKPNKCNKTTCRAQNGPIGLPYYRDDIAYQRFNECNCTGGECKCDSVEKESPCTGAISGHVYDALTKKPIRDAGVCDTEDKNVCDVCVVTNATGGYNMGAVPGEGGGCFFCPSTTYRIRCYHADCYKTAEDNDEAAFKVVKTDDKGNAYNVDFYLTPKPECKEADCRKLETTRSKSTDECGNVYELRTVCECKECDCICEGTEEIVTKNNKNQPPNQPDLYGPDGKKGSYSGYRNTPYTFTAVGNGDKEGNKVTFVFDWGDGKPTEIGPMDSYARVNTQHTWKSSKGFTVKLTTRDCSGKSSNACDFYMDII